MPNMPWKDLDQRTRRIIVGLGVFEGLLKIAALVDLVRRPAQQVRGSKPRWAAAITLINSAGVIPIIYFVRGRQKD